MLDFDPNALTIPCGHFINGALVPALVQWTCGAHVTARPMRRCLVPTRR
jgi:hypothetical protein